jgi:hypothetical protein
MKTPRTFNVGVSASKRCFRLKFRATFSAAQDNGRTRAACTRFSMGGTPKDLSLAKPIARSMRHRSVESNLASDISVNYTITPLKYLHNAWWVWLEATSARTDGSESRPYLTTENGTQRETGNRIIGWGTFSGLRSQPSGIGFGHSGSGTGPGPDTWGCIG